MPDLQFRILELLSDAEFHSGETIARHIGMSRGSVWHAVRKLEALGITVYKVPRRGYRLPRRVSMLDAKQVSDRLGVLAPPLGVRVIAETMSTNTLLMAEAGNGVANGTVIAAEHQSRGRGRQNRVWVAPVGGALAFSLLWRFGRGAAALSGLSLAVGVAIVRALRVLGAADVGLKWPNDVLWRGCKLAGTLIEVQGDALGPSAAVIGIGINVWLSDRDRAGIDQAVSDLETVLGHEVDRNALLAEVLRALHAVLVEFERTGFESLRDEWIAAHVYERRAVSVAMPDGSRMSGVVQGVASDGALLVGTASGIERLHGGEISVRPLEGAGAGSSPGALP